MPPKEADGGVSSSGVKLSEKETAMLAALAGLMGDVPEVTIFFALYSFPRRIATHPNASKFTPLKPSFPSQFSLHLEEILYHQLIRQSCLLSFLSTLQLTSQFSLHQAISFQYYTPPSSFPLSPCTFHHIITPYVNFKHL
jgi:hypothetical protein